MREIWVPKVREGCIGGPMDNGEGGGELKGGEEWWEKGLMDPEMLHFRR